MAFPLTINGTVKLAAATPGQAADLTNKLATALIAKRANSVQISGGLITFRVAIFRFVTSWNILTPITSGRITVAPGSPGSIGHSFSGVRMLVLATGMSFAFALLSPGSTGDSAVTHLMIALVAWALLFGGNYLIASWRLSSFIRNVISESTQLVSD
jgi:hypothetical protein